MKTYIVDIDNCIAHDAWRIPYINWQKTNPFQRYHDYHSLSGFDAFDDSAFKLMAPEKRVAIFTARPVHYRAITEEWLDRNNVHFDILIMRNNDDHRPSVELKAQQLNWLVSLYDVRLEEIELAFDDRRDIVEMYKARGVPAVVHELHDVCAYTKPEEHA